MIDISQLLEIDDNTFQAESNIDLEDILREEDEEPVRPSYLQESPAAERQSETQIGESEFMSILKIQQLPLKANTYALTGLHLISYWENSLILYQHGKLVKQLPLNLQVTCITMKKHITVVGFESGAVQVFESGSLRLNQKISSHASAIIALAILDENLEIASSDLDGNVNLTKFEQALFRTKQSTQTLISKASCPITQLLSYEMNGQMLLSLANQSIVLTMQTKPKIKIIHVFERQKSSIDLHFGKCYIQANLQQVLSIQWNSFIQLVTYVDQQPWYLSYYNADIPLLCAKFISDYLMIAAYQGGFQVLYIPYFTSGKFQFRYDIKALISSQIYHSNISCIRVLHNSIYFLTSNSLTQLHALSWLQYFKTLIQQEPPQWQVALHFLIQVYAGNVKGMPGLELEEDRVTIKTLISTLVESILNYQMNSVVLNLCVRFVLMCDCPDKLTQIKEAARRQQMLANYYQIIEQNLSKITELPKDVFLDFANSLSPEAFQKLVINLNLQSIDIGYTYDVCLSKQIYTPLLYICPRQEEDFITPLNKMFETQKPLLFEKCLWFIEITQKQILFPNDSIPIDVWRKAIRQQMLWLMEVLNYFLCEKLFQILFRYLSHPCFGALQHEDVYSYFSISNARELATCVYEQVSKIDTKQFLLQYLLFTSKIITQIEVKNPDFLLIKIFIFTKSYLENYNSAPEDLDSILQIIHHLMPHYSLMEEAAEYKCVDYIAYCWLAQGQVTAAIQSFFQVEELNLRVYKWLEQQPFTPDLLKSLDALLELDPEKCASVLQLWPIDVLERLIIMQPTKQLLSVFKLLKMDFQPFLQLKLIELMSIHEPEGVVMWLQNKPFPLEEVEGVFERTKNIEGQGFISELKGNYKAAIQFYLEIYKLESQQYLVSFRNQERVAQTFANLMRTCKLACQADEENQSLYIYIGKQLFNHQMHVSHWCKLKKSFIFNQQFSQLFMNMFKTSPTQLIKIVDANCETFNQIHLKSSFVSVFKEFGYERKLVKMISTVIKNDNIQLLNELFFCLNRSNLFAIDCLECEKNIQEDQAILLKCGHSVHAGCVQNKYCTKCQNISSQALLEQINVELIKKSILTDGMDQQKLQLLQNPDDEEGTHYEPIQIDRTEMEEMRQMNKLQIFDNYIEDAEAKINAFIEQYY